MIFICRFKQTLWENEEEEEKKHRRWIQLAHDKEVWNRKHTQKKNTQRLTEERKKRRE